MNIVTNKKDLKIPFSCLKPGDTFTFNDSLCMSIVIPKLVLGLNEDSPYFLGCYINLDTNSIGPIKPDTKVEIVNASIVIDD